MAHKTAM